jgi:uncharacterized protein YndB with AHSA1/START domain
VTLLDGFAWADIEAPIARCWEIVEALEDAPAWQTGLQRVEVVERDAAGRPAVCDIAFSAKVHQVRCRVRVDYDPPHRLTFTRLESEDIDALEGCWELEETGAGTRATYRLAVDPGPVPLVARPLVRALRPLVVGGRPGELARAVAARE